MKIIILFLLALFSILIFSKKIESQNIASNFHLANELNYNIKNSNRSNVPETQLYDSKDPLVLFDLSKENKPHCSYEFNDIPIFDSQVIPISFTLSDGTTQIRLSAQNLNGSNHWVIGNIEKSTGTIKNLNLRCESILTSPLKSDDFFSGGQWLTGFLKLNTRLYGFVHNEFYDGTFPQNNTMPTWARCYGDIINCTWISVSQFVSHDGGYFNPINGYENSLLSVIARPKIGVPQGGVLKTSGYLLNTNVVPIPQTMGGYMLLTNFSTGTICTARNEDIRYPSGWKTFNPATGTFSENVHSGGDCIDNGMQLLPFYIGYNTYFNSYIAVGSHRSKNLNYVLSYALSYDLVKWSEPVSLGIIPGSGLTGKAKEEADHGWGNYNYPSLMDIDSLLSSLNDVATSGVITGRNPWFLYVDHNKDGSYGSRLMGIEMSFTKTPTPVINQFGLGCDDLKCVWIQGRSFYNNCRVDLYSSQWNPLDPAEDVRCASDLVTYRIPENVYSNHKSIRFTIVNMFEDGSQTHNHPVYLNYR